MNRDQLTTWNHVGNGHCFSCLNIGNLFRREIDSQQIMRCAECRDKINYAHDPERQDLTRLYCNNCGGAIYFPDRGIFPFGGRFCGHDCKLDFDLKEAKWIMRDRR